MAYESERFDDGEPGDEFPVAVVGGDGFFGGGEEAVAAGTEIGGGAFLEGGFDGAEGAGDEGGIVAHVRAVGGDGIEVGAEFGESIGFPCGEGAEEIERFANRGLAKCRCPGGRCG